MTLRRFEDDISGTSDASGSVSLIWRGMTGQFASLLLIAQAAGGGSPSWVLNLNGSPVNVGRGTNSPIRLPLVAPGDAWVLVGSGLLPNSKVTGHFVGYAADSIEELPIGPPEPSTISTDIRYTPALLKPSPFTVPATQVVSRTVVPPAGSIALKIGAVTSPAGTALTYSLLVTGHQTGIQYWPNTGIGRLAPSNPMTPLIVPIELDWDSSYDLSIGGDPTNQLIFDVSALPQVEAVEVYSQTPLPIQASTTPPLWQAPRAYATQELAAVSSVEMIAGNPGQTIRIFGWNIEIDQATAATIGWLEDEQSAVGAVAGRIAAAVSSSNGGQSGYYAGLPLTVGKGLRLNVPLLTAGIVRAQVSYSQG